MAVNKIVTAGGTPNTKKKIESKPIAAKVKTTTKPVGNGASDDNVAIRGYVSSEGFGGITKWDGENVTVGGTPIMPSYLIDGTAYAPKMQVDKVLSDYKERNGIRGRDGIEAAYESRYGSAVDDALNSLLSRDEFSYDAESDPAYKAYRDKYLREAEAAYRRVLNDNNTSVYGASGAVLSEAMAGRDEYLKKLADMVPQLVSDAYSRYESENDRLSGNLNSLRQIADEYYNRLYTLDKDAAERAGNAAEAENEQLNRESLIRSREYNDELNRVQSDKTRQEIAKGNIELSYYPLQLEAELNEKRIESINKAEDNAMKRAAARGFFTREDETAIPWLAAYRSGSGYSVTPWEAEVRKEYDLAHAKAKAAAAAKAGL